MINIHLSLSVSCWLPKARNDRHLTKPRSCTVVWMLPLAGLFCVHTCCCDLARFIAPSVCRRIPASTTSDFTAISSDIYSFILIAFNFWLQFILYTVIGVPFLAELFPFHHLSQLCPRTVPFSPSTVGSGVGQSRLDRSQQNVLRGCYTLERNVNRFMGCAWTRLQAE